MRARREAQRFAHLGTSPRRIPAARPGSKTERTVPSPIFVAAMTGGCIGWLRMSLPEEVTAVPRHDHRSSRLAEFGIRRTRWAGISGHEWILLPGSSLQRRRFRSRSRWWDRIGLFPVAACHSARPLSTAMFVPLALTATRWLGCRSEVDPAECGTITGSATARKCRGQKRRALIRGNTPSENTAGPFVNGCCLRREPPDIELLQVRALGSLEAGSDDILAVPGITPWHDRKPRLLMSVC